MGGRDSSFFVDYHATWRKMACTSDPVQEPTVASHHRHNQHQLQRYVARSAPVTRATNSPLVSNFTSPATSPGRRSLIGAAVSQAVGALNAAPVNQVLRKRLSSDRSGKQPVTKVVVEAGLHHVQKMQRLYGLVGDEKGTSHHQDDTNEMDVLDPAIQDIIRRLESTATPPHHHTHHNSNNNINSSTQQQHTPPRWGISSSVQRKGDVYFGEEDTTTPTTTTTTNTPSTTTTNAAATSRRHGGGGGGGAIYHNNNTVRTPGDGGLMMLMGRSPISMQQQQQQQQHGNSVGGGVGGGVNSPSKRATPTTFFHNSLTSNNSNNKISTPTRLKNHHHHRHAHDDGEDEEIDSLINWAQSLKPDAIEHL